MLDKKQITSIVRRIKTSKVQPWSSRVAQDIRHNLNESERAELSSELFKRGMHTEVFAYFPKQLRVVA